MANDRAIALAVKSIDKNLKQSFSNLREEMDMHLDSINANTQEINANYDHLLKIETRMDKLEEKLENIQLLMSNFLKNNPVYDEKDFDETTLNVREQEVFLVLYTSHDKKLSFTDISKRLALTNEIVERTVDTLVAKKVPVIKTFEEGNLTLSLEENFKNFQAKKNALNISESVTKSIMNH